MKREMEYTIVWGAKQWGEAVEACTWSVIQDDWDEEIEMTSFKCNLEIKIILGGNDTTLLTKVRESILTMWLSTLCQPKYLGYASMHE